jgi:glucan-binding YG repeat protein
MKISFRKRLLTVAGMVMLLSVPAYAAGNVSTVRIDLCPEASDSMEAGDINYGEEPAVYDGLYFVYNYSVSGGTKTPKKSYTYTIDIHPNGDAAFTDTCAVEVKGATKVKMLSRSASQIRVEATTYPFYILKDPKNFMESADEFQWDKVPYADKYSVYVYYTDSEGDRREAHITTSGNKHSVNVASYNNGSNTVQSISVQAQGGTNEGSRFLASSQYIMNNGMVDTDKTSSEYEFRIPTASTNAITTGTDSAKVKNKHSAENLYGPGFNIQTGTPTTTLTGNGTKITGNASWMQKGNDWYFVQNGNFLTGWISTDGVNWFLLGSNGKKLSGLQRVDGRWYLLNTVHDGTFGRMLTGWWKINDKWYYFNEAHDGTFGAMYVKTVTPDGRHVGEDGAWLGY